MQYDPNYVHPFGRPWETSGHFGASLKSYELLAQQKGYKLVGCNIGGVDAVFVRADVVGDKFLSPFTAEVHYPRNGSWRAAKHIKSCSRKYLHRKQFSPER